MTSSPELAGLLVASSWPSTIVALVLFAGVAGVLILNGRSRRRFHERNAADRRDPGP